MGDIDDNQHGDIRQRPSKYRIVVEVECPHIKQGMGHIQRVKVPGCTLVLCDDCVRAIQEHMESYSRS